MAYKPPYTRLNTRRSRGGGRNKALYFFGGLAAILFLGGLYITFNWVSAGGIGSISLFATDTPTPTITPTPSDTPTITPTVTITPTPTLEPSPTASAPFLYTVESGDTLSTIAEKFDVDFIIIMILNGLDNSSVLFGGQQLIIPNPDMEIPQPTTIPAGLPRGFEIEYLVLPGDTIALIAESLLSTEDAIIDANDLENPNQLFVGQLLVVPINLITPTPGPSPTPVTPAATGAATASPTP